MILGASTQFLCHSVDVRICSVKTKDVKRSHKEFQSGSCPGCGGTHPTKSLLMISVMMCCFFDHQSWLLATNLTISFLSWDYQCVLLC